MQRQLAQIVGTKGGGKRHIIGALKRIVLHGADKGHRYGGHGKGHRFWQAAHHKQQADLQRHEHCIPPQQLVLIQQAGHRHRHGNADHIKAHGDQVGKHLLHIAVGDGHTQQGKVAGLGIGKHATL